MLGVRRGDYREGAASLGLPLQARDALLELMLEHGGQPGLCIHVIHGYEIRIRFSQAHSKAIEIAMPSE